MSDSLSHKRLRWNATRTLTRSRTSAHPVRTWTRVARRSTCSAASTCGPHALPDLSSPRAGVDALAGRSPGVPPGARRGPGRSTCGAVRRVDFTRCRTSAHPRADVDAFARRSTRARRSTCGAARRATWTALPARRRRSTRARRSTCNAARRRADLDGAPGPQLTLVRGLRWMTYGAVFNHSLRGLVGEVYITAIIGPTHPTTGPFSK